MSAQAAVGNPWAQRAIVVGLGILMGAPLAYQWTCDPSGPVCTDEEPFLTVETWWVLAFTLGLAPGLLVHATSRPIRAGAQIGAVAVLVETLGVIFENSLGGIDFAFFIALLGWIHLLQWTALGALGGAIANASSGGKSPVRAAWFVMAVGLIGLWWNDAVLTPAPGALVTTAALLAGGVWMAVGKGSANRVP